MTVKDAKSQGYTITDMKLFRGYVSRKINIDEQNIIDAGGNRKGEMYYEAPNYGSTRYSYRIYIKLKEDN